MDQVNLFGEDESQIWVPYSEFAKEIGKSAEAVRKAIKNDRFDMHALRTEQTKTGKPKYKINLKEGKRQWDDNRGGADYIPPKDENKNDAKMREQVANANMAELKYLEMDGQLIRADAAKLHFAKIATTIRESFLCLPVKLGAELACVHEPHEIEAILKERFTEVLKELSYAGRSGELFK